MKLDLTTLAAMNPRPTCDPCPHHGTGPMRMAEIRSFDPQPTTVTFAYCWRCLYFAQTVSRYRISPGSAVFPALVMVLIVIAWMVWP